MSTLIKGDQVVMTGCGEAEEPAYQGVVWTCAGHSFGEGTQERVFLEGLGSCFMVNCLRKASSEEIRSQADRLTESAATTTRYQAVIYGVAGGSYETQGEALDDIVEYLLTAPDDLKKIMQLHIAALNSPQIPASGHPVTLDLYHTAYQLVVSKTALPVQAHYESK